ncbi:MAG TPA: hypothetical protein VFE61_26885 [Candidatus Sulfotelmatobacter sp.]|nr:hypothetical protein [Candidatus Sulfotelmatobacter sp.]
MDIQINGETYFLTVAEDERKWLVLVESASGVRPVPVYEDVSEFEELSLVVEDKLRRKILN